MGQSKVSFSAEGRRWSKELALDLMGLGGLFWLGRRLSSRSVVAITYHRVLPGKAGIGQSRPSNSLYEDEFERQVAFLTKRYHIVSGDEFASFVQGRHKLPPCSVLVTFDDGYENNYTVAWPILRRYGATGVIFLTTNLIGKPNAALWFDRLDHLLSVVPRQEIRRWIHSESMAVKDDMELRVWLKGLAGPDRDRMIDNLERQVGHCVSSVASREQVGLLSWDQVRELVGHGMTMGSHTATHQILSACSPEYARLELVQSRRRIEDEIGRPCWCFGYPNGQASDFRASDQQAVRDAGYFCAFTQMPGYVRRETDRLALPRIPVPDSGDLRIFNYNLSGIGQVVRTLRASGRLICKG